MQMSKLFVIAIRWTQLELEPERVDWALGPIGRWLRYNADTWFVATHLNAPEIYEKIRPSVGSSGVMVLEINPLGQRSGLAPPWVWDWFDEVRPYNALTQVR